MSSSMLGKFEKPFLRWITRLFSDDQLVRTITYQHYQGRDDNDESIMMPFTTQAICTQDLLSSLDTPNDVKLQSGDRTYLLWSHLIPTGITVDNLTPNDRIVDGSSDYIVTKINKSARVIFPVTVIGA